MKIAICGKGGVGKSTIATLLIESFLSLRYEVLAIDADPSPHLARLLGFSEEENIVPLADMKDLLAERAEKQGPFYNLNPKIEDLPEKFMLKRGALRLMVLGAIQEAGAGCACPEQTVLRRLLSFLLLSSKEVVIVDMEAGVEHLGRSTISGVDFLLGIVQPYLGSIKTAIKIKKLAQQLEIENILWIGNLIQKEEDKDFIETHLQEKLFFLFPLDRGIIQAERQGLPLRKASLPLLRKAQTLIERLEEIRSCP